MNKSIKSALLSALIFPGVGQISAGYKKKGWSFITVSSLLLYLIVNKVIQQANSIINEMQQSGIAINVEEISNKVSASIGFSDNTYLNILLLLFIIGWIISIVDAYLLNIKKSPQSEL